MARYKSTAGKRVAKPRLAAALPREDYRLLADFRFLLRRFLAFSEHAARENGLSPQQHQALLALKSGKASTATDLAGQLLLKHHSVVGLVNRLADMRLVRRKADASDKRKAILALTALAETKLRALTAMHKAELKRITPLLRPLLEELDGKAR